MKLSRIFENVNPNNTENKAHSTPVSEIKNIRLKIKFLKKEANHLQTMISRNDAAMEDNVLAATGKNTWNMQEGDPTLHTPEVRKFQDKGDVMSGRINTIRNTITTLNNTISRLLNPEALKLLDAHKVASDQRGWSDDIDIAKYIPRSSTIPRGFLSPCSIHGSQQHYEGRPWNYPRWTNIQLQWYKAYSDLLVRLKLPGFTKMYGSLKHGMVAKPYIVIIGNNGDFVFQMNSSTKQSLYVNGHLIYRPKWTPDEIASGKHDDRFISILQGKRY